MKVIKIISVTIVLIVLALIIAIFSLPSEAHMERSVVITATPDEVYRELVSYRNFNIWSPWALKDTSAQYQYEGPAAGAGTKILWQSNHPDVGNGYMQILEVVENKKVTSVMHFDGYEGNPTASFILEPVPAGTRLTWTYDETDVTGISKIYLLGIDGFLGDDYEKGLQKIKERVESAPSFSYPIAVKNIDSFTYVGVKDSSLNDPSLLSTKMALHYGRLMSLLGNRGIEVVGYPIAFYNSYNDQDLSFTCALPVKPTVELEDADIFKGKSPDGLAIMVHYEGDYTRMENAYREIEQFASFYNYQLKGNPWEEYLTDPENEPDTSLWITNIYYPVE